MKNDSLLLYLMAYLVKDKRMFVRQIGSQPCWHRFATAEGDLVTYLNVWKAWEDSGRSRKWAERNLLSQRVLLRAADIRGQLLYHLR